MALTALTDLEHEAVMLLVDHRAHVELLAEGARHVEGDLALLDRALHAGALLLAADAADEIPARRLKTNESTRASSTVMSDGSDVTTAYVTGISSYVYR